MSDAAGENEIEQLRARNAALEAANASLQHRVEELLHRLYGKKAERREDDHPQLPFPGDEPEPPPPPHVDEAEDEEFETITYKRKKRGATRISKDMPRETVRVAIDEADRKCPCCGEPMEQIGEEVSERIDYMPAGVKVSETIRPKYACKHHEEAGVLTAEPPIHPIQKGMATAGLLSQVLVAKYKDHLPLYRQNRIFARHGADIPESTLCDWVRQAADMLQPVVAAMRTSVLESEVVQTDDTPVLVIDRQHQQGRRHGFLWAYVGDRAEVVFDFTAGRSRAGPARFLDGYRGILQADAYAAYDHIYATGHVVEAGCMAHARRKFVEAEKADPINVGHVLAAMRKLYFVERQAKQQSLDADGRRDLRQRESKPILEVMGPWIRELHRSVLPKSPLGKATGYAVRQWGALSRFVGDGRIEIDNIRGERQMRQVAVGRKNWLFAGSDAGGVRAAIIYSLVCTCGLLGIEPWAYFKDVLQRLAEGDAPDALTPRLWQATRNAQQS